MSVRVESGQAALERAGGKSRHPLVLAARQLSTSSRTITPRLERPESRHSEEMVPGSYAPKPDARPVIRTTRRVVLVGSRPTFEKAARAARFSLAREAAFSVDTQMSISCILLGLQS